jgi:hypothetical protein
MPAVTTTATKPLARTSWAADPHSDDPARYVALTASVAAFRAHGDTGRLMITRLSSLLDRMEALPIEDTTGWTTGVARYLGLRYGPLPRPLPPGAWGWRHTLRSWQMMGWGVAIVARKNYAALSPRQQEQAVAEFGEFRDTRGRDTPLLLMCWPQREEDALDRRAAALNADPRGRALLEHRERLRRLAALKGRG